VAALRFPVASQCSDSMQLLAHPYVDSGESTYAPIAVIVEQS
jgi:hypothetical protein